MSKKTVVKKSPVGKKKMSPARTKRTPAKKVKTEKKMTREMKPEKETAAVLEQLLPKDKTEKKKKKTKVKFESPMLREEAISYFEAIVAGLKRGSIQIRQGEDAITLGPTPQLDVSVKAASKDQDESIKIEIKWRTASDSELTISTD